MMIMIVGQNMSSNTDVTALRAWTYVLHLSQKMSKIMFIYNLSGQLATCLLVLIPACVCVCVCVEGIFVHAMSTIYIEINVPFYKL